MNRYLKRIGLAVTLCCTSSIASAQSEVPREVQDLLYAEANSGQASLESMGYEWMNNEDGTDSTSSNWWKESSKSCLTIVTKEGRYESITASPESDCQRHSADHKGD